MSDNTVTIEESNEEFDDDFDLEDKRDRRAIDEEDDEDFLQELDELTREMRKDRENVRHRCVIINLARCSRKLFIVRYIDEYAF